MSAFSGEVARLVTSETEPFSDVFVSFFERHLASVEIRTRIHGIWVGIGWWGVSGGKFYCSLLLLIVVSLGKSYYCLEFSPVIIESGGGFVPCFDGGRWLFK